MDRSRLIRIGIVAGVVAIVALTLALASREGSDRDGPVTSSEARGGGRGGDGAMERRGDGAISSPPARSEGSDVPLSNAPLRRPIAPSPHRPIAPFPPRGADLARGPETAARLPSDHPPVEPAPDEA